MSLTQTLNKAVEDIVHTFIKQIADKHDLDPSSLLELWEGTQSPEGPKPDSVASEIDEARLLKCNKSELQALCKSRGLKTTGTKARLISALQGNTSADTKPVPKSKKSSGKKAPAVVKKLTTTAIQLRRNQYRNYEHAETSLVFDGKTQKVIGHQNDDGSISALTAENIDVCNQYKFNYDLPADLNADTRLEDTHVEELDDDSENEIIESDDDPDEDLVEEDLLEDDVVIDDDEDDDDDDEEYGYQY